jgi:hypothetical protein
MRTWSFYDPETGLFRARSFTGPSRALAINTPDGFVAIEGKHDHLCRRIDLRNLAIVPYQPPQPDADHEWNAGTERWVKRAEVQMAESARVKAQARIDHLERRQARRVRELLAEGDPQLKAIDDEVAALRAELSPKG